MSAKKNRPLRTLGALMLLGAGVWGGVIGFYRFTAGDDNGSSAGATADQRPAVDRSLDALKRSAAQATTGPALTPPKQGPIRMEPGGLDALAQPGAVLGEGELEHLRDVFLTTVYPAFQQEFRFDAAGRSAINVFVASMPEGLSQHDLETISSMIEAQLASTEAEDLAFILTHLYRLGEEETRTLAEGVPIRTMTDQLEAQAQLAELREQWLGKELATLFFAPDEETGEGADGRSVNASFADTQTEALTAEQAELAAIERAWEQRYQRFMADRRVIDDAGLAQAEKDRQIEQLLHQHYTHQELEAARAYGRAHDQRR